MKKRITVLLGFFLFAGSIFGATTEQEVERTQFWGRLNFQAKNVYDKFGIFAMVGSRNNLGTPKITSTTNNVTTEAKNLENMGSWLNEAWIGPMYNAKLTPKFMYVGILAYRPQMWFYGDAEKFSNVDYSVPTYQTQLSPYKSLKNYYGKEHVRHTVDFNNNFIYNLGFMKVKYRLILWDTLPYTDGGFTKNAQDTTKDYEWSNELISRNLLGINVPIFKWLDLVLEEEVFLNLTPNAEEGDLTFQKNLVWAGFDVKPVKGLNISLRYMNSITFAEGDANADYLANTKKTITDNYIFTQVTYAMDFKDNKKAKEMMDKAKESDEYKDTEKQAKEKAEAEKAKAEKKKEEKGL